MDWRSISSGNNGADGSCLSARMTRTACKRMPYDAQEGGSVRELFRRRSSRTRGERARRTDSGIAQIQRQLPVLTQGVPAYDLLIAADESEVFASYLPYRTWDPRPVAGSSGLVPTTWDASHDQWGAVQMQSRFTK